MSNIKAFGTFTQDSAKKTREQMGSGQDWIKFEKNVPKVLRFLPPMVGEDLPWVIVHQHFIKVPGSKNVVFNCPRKMENRRCPACEKRDKLLSTGNPADEKLASDFRPSFRAFARAIDRENPEAGVQPVGFGKTVMNRLNSFREGNKLNPNGIDFTDPENGYDLVIEYLGKDPWYEVQIAQVPSPLAKTDEGLSTIVEQAQGIALAGYGKILTWDKIVEKFSDQPQVQNAKAGQAALGTSMVDVDDSDDAF
jgi:hypothetical protein